MCLDSESDVRVTGMTEPRSGDQDSTSVTKLMDFHECPRRSAATAAVEIATERPRILWCICKT